MHSAGTEEEFKPLRCLVKGMTVLNFFTGTQNITGSTIIMCRCKVPVRLCNILMSRSVNGLQQ